MEKQWYDDIKTTDKLVAAAPDLLRAINNLVAYIEAGVDTKTFMAVAHKENSCLYAARAAIRKAKGE